MANNRRGHHQIVADLKEQLRSKGFKILPFPKQEAMIAEIGHDALNPKIKHTAFRPDIIMSGDEEAQDIFFLEYVHTEKRYVHDLRGMIALSSMIKKARAFILIINDSIYPPHGPLKGVIGEVERMSLSLFRNALNKYSKEVFLRYLEG